MTNDRHLIDDRPQTPPEGLTEAEVAERVARGDVNTDDERTSRSLGEIVRANVLTRFNALLGTLFVLILIVGPAQDALFGFVIFFNTLIGIVQEVRAKRGWSYGAYSSLPIDRRRQAFSMWTFPKAEDAAPCITLQLQMLHDLRSKGITKKELTRRATELQAQQRAAAITQMTRAAGPGYQGPAPGGTVNVGGQAINWSVK